MKKIVTILFLCATLFVNAQNLNFLNYDRSSLATMMIFHPEDEFCKDIADEFNAMPIPDKYDDISTNIRFIDFNGFYGVKKKNETYAFRSQTNSEMDKNEAKYDSFKKNGQMLVTCPFYDELYKQQWCKQLKIKYVKGETTWDEVNAKYGRWSSNKQQSAYNSIPRGLHKAKYGKILSGGQVEKNAKAIEEMLNGNDYAKRIVAQWFNLHGDDINNATFDMSIVADRGHYNANAEDLNFAEQSARGVSMLYDSGLDLVEKSYVLVNDITYVTTEEKAQAAKIATSVILSVLGALAGQSASDITQTVQAVNDIADSFTGFDIKVHSYLYRINWDEETANTFYALYYTETPNPDKIAAFLQNDTLFRLDYVAHAFSTEGKSVSKGVNRSEYVRYIANRAIDENVRQLQKVYEDFKVTEKVAEVYKDGGATCCYAKIGTKEGITKDTKFQVVTPVINPKTNRVTYKYVATVKPIKNKIWDNQYYITQERPVQNVDATHFKKVSGGEILPGMLLIEGKYKKISYDLE